MFACDVHCYPWDLTDEGIGEVLDRLRDRIGATALTLVGACDAVEYFRPHVGVEPRWVRNPGGVFFEIEQDGFAATRIKPPLWDSSRRQDFFGRVSEGCADRKMEMQIRLCLFRSRRIVGRHPEVACKNVFGMPSRYAMCPHHPDVREYAMALIRELHRADNVAGIVLEDASSPRATDAESYWSATSVLNSEPAGLLNLCFCESSQQEAAKNGVDVEAAKRGAVAILDRGCQVGAEPEVDGRNWSDRNPAVARYEAWTQTQWTRLLQELRSSGHKRFVLNAARENFGLSNSKASSWPAEGDDRILLSAFDFVAHQENLEGNSGTEGGFHQIPRSQWELLLPWCEDSPEDAPATVREISRCAEAGMAGVSIDHYAAIREDQYDWIHQGLRRARRITTA